MISCESLKMLSKDTCNLPESSFYLGYADILLIETDRKLNKGLNRDMHCNYISKVEQYLSYAIQLFDKDKQYYTDIQKKGFLERKIKLCEHIKKTQVKLVKLLIKELEII